MADTWSVPGYQLSMSDRFAQTNYRTNNSLMSTNVEDRRNQPMSWWDWFTTGSVLRLVGGSSNPNSTGSSGNNSMPTVRGTKANINGVFAQYDGRKWVPFSGKWGGKTYVNGKVATGGGTSSSAKSSSPSKGQFRMSGSLQQQWDGKKWVNFTGTRSGVKYKSGKKVSGGSGGTR